MRALGRRVAVCPGYRSRSAWSAPAQAPADQRHHDRIQTRTPIQTVACRELANSRTRELANSRTREPANPRTANCERSHRPKNRDRQCLQRLADKNPPVLSGARGTDLHSSNGIAEL